MDVTILIGTEKGGFVLRADERRRSFRVTGPLFKGWRVTAFCRAHGGDWIAATASPVYGAALHRSADLADWRQIEEGPRFAEHHGAKLNEIWTVVRGEKKLFAGVAEAGLFESADDGATWRLVESLTAQESRPRWVPGFGGLCAHSILAAAGDRRLWVGISAVGVFRSADGGATWTAANRGVTTILEDEHDKEIGRCVHALAHDPRAPDTIWRQDHRGMYRTRDGGASWQKIEDGLPSGFGFPIARAPASGALFCVPLESDEYRMPAGGRLRVFRSTDGGDSWHDASNGLPREQVWTGVLRGALATDPLDPAGVYAGTSSGNVHASADGGDSWITLPVVLPRILTVAAFAGVPEWRT